MTPQNRFRKAAMPELPANTATTYSVRDRVLARLSTGEYSGPRAYRMWHPPLTFPTALDTLLRRDAEQHPQHTHLRIPMGLIDEPRRHSQHVWSIQLTGSHSNAAIAGAKLTGKSTLLLTMIMSAAATHSPRDLQFYCIDLSTSLLTHAADLPHVGAVATALDTPLIFRIVAELSALLEARRQSFKNHRVVDMDAYRRLRSDPSNPLSEDPYGDAVLVVDGWAGITDDHDQEPEYEKLVKGIAALAEKGPGFGIHVVVTTTLPTNLRKIRDLLGLKIELFPADADNTVLTDNRRTIRTIPKIPGRAMSSEYRHLMIGAPRLDGQNTMDGIGDTYPQSRAQIKQQWMGVPPAPQIHPLPDRIHINEILQKAPSATPDDSYATRWTIPIGLAESTMEPATANLAKSPHLLVFGATESGRTTALRSVVKAILARNNEKQVAFMVIDYRTGLLGLIPQSYLLPTMYLRNPGELERGRFAPILDTAEAIAEFNQLSAIEKLRRKDPISVLAEKLAKRRPPDDLTPEQLNARSWWSDYDIVLLIDNWDMVIQTHPGQVGALSELNQYISSATDVGFHLIASCHMSAANSVVGGYRGIIATAYKMGSPTILLSGQKNDFPSERQFTVTQRPPGQGLYKTSKGLDVIQTAYCEPPE
jgi:type VII secretion protein EccCb